MRNLLLLIFGFFLGLCLPAAVLAGSTYYVDVSNTGTEDGSSDNPYNTLAEALDRADDDDKVSVKAGNYAENIEVPDGVELEGDNKESVIIQGKSSKLATVKLDHETKIKNVTVTKGKYGIQVKDESEAEIKDCIIKDNKKDGIRVDGESLSSSYLVEISDNVIQDNGRAGIYGKEEANLEIKDNTISNNDGDGVYLQSNVLADVDDNIMEYNDKSGADLMMDGSNLVLKDNEFSHNDESGLDVHTMDGTGEITGSGNKFYRNKKYGIRKIQHHFFRSDVWEFFDLVKSKFKKNKSKDITEKLKS